MDTSKIVSGSILALLVILLVILVIMGYNNMKYRNAKQTGYGKAKTAWGKLHPSDPSGTDTPPS